MYKQLSSYKPYLIYKPLLQAASFKRAAHSVADSEGAQQWPPPKKKKKKKLIDYIFWYQNA